MIDQARLKEVLQYDPDTGEFIWRQRMSSRAPVGGRAGVTRQDGYVKISIDKRQYFAHRLAHLYMTGKWPQEIDHRDRNPSNNRWGNLRAVSRSVNLENRACAGWYKRPSGYCAQIVAAGAKRYLGTYPTEAGARAAYELADYLYRGED